MGAKLDIVLFLVAAICGAGLGCWIVDRRHKEKLLKIAERLLLKERAIEDLRQELAADKLVNRKLRYTLARQNTDGVSAGLEEFTEMEELRDRVGALEDELDRSRVRLAKRNEAMRVARVAIQEIREQVEGTSGTSQPKQNGLAQSEAEFVGVRLASLEDATGEITLENDAAKQLS